MNKNVPDKLVKDVTLMDLDGRIVVVPDAVLSTDQYDVHDETIYQQSIVRLIDRANPQSNDVEECTVISYCDFIAFAYDGSSELRPSLILQKSDGSYTQLVKATVGDNWLVLNSVRQCKLEVVSNAIFATNS